MPAAWVDDSLDRAEVRFRARGLAKSRDLYTSADGLRVLARYQIGESMSQIADKRRPGTGHTHGVRPCSLRTVLQGRT